MPDEVEARQEAFDREAALRRFGGDAAALNRSTEAFSEGCPERLAEIREALSRGSGKDLERAAYRLGWALSLFSAAAALDAALKLERMGREGNINGAETVYRVLEAEIGRLKEALAGT